MRQPGLPASLAAVQYHTKYTILWLLARSHRSGARMSITPMLLTKAPVTLLSAQHTCSQGDGWHGLSAQPAPPPTHRCKLMSACTHHMHTLAAERCRSPTQTRSSTRNARHCDLLNHTIAHSRYTLGRNDTVEMLPVCRSMGFIGTAAHRK